MFYFVIKCKALCLYAVQEESYTVQKSCFKNIPNAKLHFGLKISIRQFNTLMAASDWNCVVKRLKTDVRIICSRILHVCG